MEDFTIALDPFAEPIRWRQDKPPHSVGALRGVVLHGAPDSQSAGHPLSALVADPWCVSISRTEGIVSRISVGDTLTRIGMDAEVLTVQQVMRDDSGWLVVCTAKERPSA